MQLPVNRMVSPRLVLLIVLTNLIPLYGVYSGTWTATSMLFLYCFEIVIAGAIHVVKIWTRVDQATLWPKDSRDWLRWIYSRARDRLLETALFSLIFGISTLYIWSYLIHLLYCDARTCNYLEITIDVFKTIVTDSLYWAALGLFLSHLFMLITYWFANKQFRQPKSLQIIPHIYIRSLVLFIAISIATVMHVYGEYWIILLALTAIKIPVDLFFFVQNKARYS